MSRLLDPMQSGLPITLLWVASTSFFLYAYFTRDKDIRDKDNKK